MSFILSNLATEKQKAILLELEYIGTGNYRLENLSKDEAALLIDELFEEQRLADKEEIQFTKDNEW